jgi:hypothetical protein
LEDIKICDIRHIINSYSPCCLVEGGLKEKWRLFASKI